MIKKIIEKSLLVLYPDKIDLTKPHPLIILLHGVGECANDAADINAWLSYLISNGPQAFIKAVQQTYKGTDFIVIMPQLNRWDIGDVVGNRNFTWPSRYVHKALDYARANYLIDEERKYLTGLSLGGGGVWNFITESQENAELFAAAVPVCATAAPAGLCNIAKANLPIAVYHAQDDTVVSFWSSVQAMDALKVCADLKIKPAAKYPQWGGHGIWDAAYDPAGNPFGNGVNTYDFFLMNKASAPVAMPAVDIQAVSPPVVDTVIPPIQPAGVKADAGGDISIPTASSYILDGSKSSGQVGWWDQVSGPSKVWFNPAPGNFKQRVDGLKQGVYVFRLQMAGKYPGQYASDEMVLTVGKPVEKKIEFYLVTAVNNDGSKEPEKKILPENISLK